MAQFTLNRWQIALIIYLIIIGLILIFKPAIMFTLDQNPKEWALENTATTSIFAPIIAFPIIAILVYYMAAWIEVMN